MRKYEPLRKKTLSSGFSTKVDTNRDVQPQMMTRGSKFLIKEEVGGLYYPYGENKGAGQLCCNCTPDLCLCCRIYEKARSSHYDRANTYVHVFHD